MNNRQSLKRVFVLMALAIGLRASQPVARAASYTWTNTAANTSGLWTNGLLWGQSTNTTFPGSAVAGSAYLTNSTSAVYTNVLDATLTNRLNILTISNKLGESWLVVTNAQLMNTNALTLGTGGRLRIDNGGVVSNTTSLTLTGINAAVFVNNGAKLIATNSVIIGNGAGSFGNSLMITNGGWMTGKTIAIGNNATASNNMVLVTGSSTVWSNTGLLTIGTGNSNTLTIAQGAQVYLDNVQFGAGTGNQVVLTDTGTVVIASSASIMNLNGKFSSFIVSNGARFYETGATGYVQGNGSNNTFIVTGPGSVFTNSNGSGVVLNNSAAGITNKFIVSNCGLVVTPQTTLKNAPGMQLLVTGGGVLTNKSGLQVGSSGTGYASAIISNGGAIINKTGATSVGLGGGGSFASNSTLLVTGAGSVLSNAAGSLSLGQYGSGNTLTIASSGSVYSTSGYIGQTSNSHNNVAILTDTGSVWCVNGGLGVGYESSGLGFGVGNQLVVSNGALLSSTYGNIGYGLSAISNAVTVTGPGSQWTDTGTLVIGSSASGNYNRLRVNNGGQVFAAAVTIGASGNNNTITVSDPGTVLRGIGTLSLGTNGFGNQLIVSNGAVVVNGGSTLGNAVGGNSNAVTVTGTGSVWSNSDVVSIGPVGTGNRLTINAGGAVQVGVLTVYPSSTVNVNGGAIAGGPFINLGTLLVGNSQTFTFTGSTFSNAANAVLNSAGGWMVLAGASTEFDLVAGSSSNTFNFSGGTLQFSAAQAYTFGLAGQDFGGRLGATNNNYFIGNLVVSAGGGTLTLAGGPALYVGNLTLASGVTLNLCSANLFMRPEFMETG